MTSFINNHDCKFSQRALFAIVAAFSLLPGIPVNAAVVITHITGKVQAKFDLPGFGDDFDNGSFCAPPTNCGFLNPAVFEIAELTNGQSTVRAFQNAQGINAVDVTSHTLDLNSTSTWQGITEYKVKAFSNVKGGENIDFNFVINGGELRLDRFADFSDPTDAFGATVALEIAMDGSVVWRWILRLTKDGNGDPILRNDIPRDPFPRNNSFDPFGLGTPPVSSIFDNGDSRSVTIGSFTGILPITLTNFFGPPLTIDYTMAATVTAGVPGIPGDGGVFGRARIGDPFSFSSSNPLDPNASPGVSILLDGMDPTQHQFIPEPATLALLVLSSLMMSGRRRTAC